MLLVGLVVDCCSEREEPTWRPEGVFVVVPRRRRGVLDVDALLQSSKGSGDLCCLVRVDDDGRTMLSSGCFSCLVVEVNGRPLVSLGSDIAD
jgi:hypothetical protein